jgi:hypothetical protein
MKIGRYRDDEAKWPEIQDVLIDSATRLADAIKPILNEVLAGKLP